MRNRLKKDCGGKEAFIGRLDFADFLEGEGISPKMLAKVIFDGINAEIVTRDKSTGERLGNDPDHKTRLAYLDRLFELMGLMGQLKKDARDLGDALGKLDGLLGLPDYREDGNAKPVN